jgi:hypothetical protein
MAAGMTTTRDPVANLEPLAPNDLDAVTGGRLGALLQRGLKALKWAFTPSFEGRAYDMTGLSDLARSAPPTKFLGPGNPLSH